MKTRQGSERKKPPEWWLKVKYVLYLMRVAAWFIFHKIVFPVVKFVAWLYWMVIQYIIIMPIIVCVEVARSTPK